MTKAVRGLLGTNDFTWRFLSLSPLDTAVSLQTNAIWVLCSPFRLWCSPAPALYVVSACQAAFSADSAAHYGGDLMLWRRYLLCSMQRLWEVSEQVCVVCSAYHARCADMW